MSTAPMFDKPPAAVRTLSAMYGREPWLCSIYTAAPKWTAIKLLNPIPCDECFANQHEGSPLPRAQAKKRRTLDLGPRKGGKQVLNLCREHAQLWEERDERDRAPRGSR